MNTAIHMNTAAAITRLEIEARGTLASQMVLPFAEKEYIDNRRASHILGVGRSTVQRMAEIGLLSWIDYGKPSWKRINYRSLVEYCNHLRREHNIPDRRLPLSAPYLRYPDVDLLPFPLIETATAQEAMRALGFEKLDHIVGRIEEGCFEAYQLVPRAPWRIWRPSLRDFINRSTHRDRK